MVAALLTPADVLSRPRGVPTIARDFIPTTHGIRHLQASGAEIIEKGIDQGTMSFPAVISTPDIDRVGDSLNPLGCDVSDYRNNALVLLNHDSEGIPIGVAVDGNGKLYVAIEQNRVLSRCFLVQGGKFGQDAADIFHLILQRAFNCVSVGFNPHPDPRYTQRLDTGGNRYEKWFLLEWSVTAIPANPSAQIIRKYLTDGRITGKTISPRLVKCLTPLAEPKSVQVVGGFAPPAPPSAQSTPQRSNRMSKKWGKPGRSKRQAMSTTTETKAMSESNGAAGGYTAADKQGEMSNAVGRIFASHDLDLDGHYLHYKSETGELHHTHPEGADEEKLKAVGTDMAGMEGVKSVHQTVEHPSDEGWHQLYPAQEEARDNGKLHQEYVRKAQAAFHIGRGKAYMSMRKMLTKGQKDALEECVHRKIPKIAEDNPEMESDQREAVAFSLCGEKAFAEYEDKETAGGDTVEEPVTKDAPIEPDATAQAQPPSLVLAQQAIENIEAGIPGLEPEQREFWESILEQIREHGSERYPGEDFGGDESPSGETANKAEERADEVVDAYSRTPEEKRVSRRVVKSLQMIQKNPDLLKSLCKGLEMSATHHHKVADMTIGKTLTKSDKEESREHGRMMDHLHGAVKHTIQGEEDTKPEDEPIKPEDDGGGETEAVSEVEKLFASVVTKTLGGNGNAAPLEIEKRADDVFNRLGSIFGTRMP